MFAISKEKIKSIALLGLITFIVVWFSVHSCEKSETKFEDKHPDSTAYYRGKLEALQAEAAKKVILSHLDSVRTAKELQAMSGQITKLEKAIIPVRRSIQPLVDTVAIVAEYVVLTDSLISAIQAQNDTLHAEKARIWRALSGINFNKDQQIQVLTELNQHVETVNKDLNRDLKRERRRKTTWKIVAGVLTVGIIYQSIDK